MLASSIGARYAKSNKIVKSRVRVTLPVHFRPIGMPLIASSCRLIGGLLVGGVILFGQTGADSNKVDRHSHPSAKHDVGSGAGDIGKGAGKGVASAAKGTGKSAADLVTLHPINAATDLGRGAVGAGKNVGVGAGKGTGKMLRGAGKALKHIF